jgi:hypothetical protein
MQVLMTVTKQSVDGTGVPSTLCFEAVIKPARNTPMPNVQWKTPDDGQRGCPKDLEFYDRVNLDT